MSEEVKSSSTESNAEPTATRSNAPMWIIVLTLALLYLGFVFFDKHSGWFDSKIYSPYSSSEELQAFQPMSGAAAEAAHGKKVYEAVCGICHGVDGLGKPGQAPPLAGSEWVDAKGFARLAHIPLAGLSGTVKVKGQDWNLNMAAMGAALSDGDLAGVLTYIRSAWGNKAEPVSADDIHKVRAEMGKSPLPMNSVELMKMPE